MKRRTFLISSFTFPISHFPFLICVAMTMAAMLTLSGCVEEYEADIPSEDSDLLVVEGSICSSSLNKFILSRTRAINSINVPRMVAGAVVAVRGTDGSEYLAQATNDYYTCWIDALNPDVDYFLHIEADGEVYESELQKPLRTESIAEVGVVQYTPESNIDVLVTPEAPFDQDKVNYYSWTYDETWEVRPEYTTVVYYDTKIMGPVYKKGLFPERGWKNALGTTVMVGASHSYKGQHIERLKVYDLDRNNERVYYKYSGLIHQRAITKAEYEYELARRQAGSEMGGLFTPLPSALPTNIHCLTSKKHVIGYVGCSLNTSEYRFFVHAKDFSITIPQHGDLRTWYVDPSTMFCYLLVERGLFLCEWENEIKSSDGKVHTAWAYPYLLDVRLHGAYTEEPDFWEDED